MDWLSSVLSSWDRFRAYWGTQALLQIAALDLAAAAAAALTRV